TFYDFYLQAFGKEPTGAKYQALFLMNDISTKMQRGVFLPKGSPMEAALALRQAFHAVEKDKDFIEDYRKITGEEPELVPGEEVACIFDRIPAAAPEARRVRRGSVGAEKCFFCSFSPRVRAGLAPAIHSFCLVGKRRRGCRRGKLTQPAQPWLRARA